MPLLVRVIDRINNQMVLIAAVILGLMTFVILLEIFLWNTLSTSTLIADEYSAYGLAAITFLGAGFCLKEKGHIRINLVLVALPAKLTRIVTFVSTCLATVFMGCLWWYLFKMVASTVRYQSTSGTLTNTPLWIPQTVMLIGAAAFVLQFLSSCIKTFQAIQTGEDVF